ncbi:UNVERIFIED_ORG: putative MFS family arabinose efflux permease [Serratia quinivorans]
MSQIPMRCSEEREISGQAQRLPMAALLALAMTGFICIATETLPAGLLPLIASGLQVSPSLAGQMITAYALGSVLAAIPLTLATQRWRRRRVLLLTIAGFFVFNTITALSSHYVVTLIARFFAGAAEGLAWSLLAGYARRMVVPHLQGKAMAVAMVGTPIALSLGVPLGTWLGAVVGWRTAFGVMSVMTLVLMVWVQVKVPDYPGQVGPQRMPLYKVLITPGVRPVLGVVMLWMFAHNILYTYVAPLVTPAGLVNQVDVVLLIFGLSALVGIWLTGRVVDGHLRKTVLASLALFAVTTLLLGIGIHSAVVVYGGMLLWGLSFGGAATLLQTALADTAGEGADAALAMNVVIWNSAIAVGGFFGGILLDRFGAESFPWASLILILGGLALVLAAKRHGFSAEARQS